jgi:hypothetical protein
MFERTSCTNVDCPDCLHTVSKCWLVGWLVNVMLRDFGPYGAQFMNVCVVITVVMVKLSRHFEPYGVMFMTTRVYYLAFYCRFLRTVYLNARILRGVLNAAIKNAHPKSQY